MGYRGGKLLLTTGALALAAVGCATSHKLVRVDQGRNEVVVYSVGDQRSAVPQPRDTDAVTTAVQNLTQTVKEHPRDVVSLLNLAKLDLAQENYDAAEATCRKALQVDLKNTDARKVLAETYLRRGNTDMASIILNGIGGSDSKDSQVLNMLAMISLKRGDNTQAMALFKRALQTNPSDVAVRMNLGVLYVKYRQLSSAQIEFERVLKLVPDHPDAKIHLAIIEASRGNYANAETLYESVLADHKNNPLALYNLAVTEQHLNKADDAIENLKTYLKTGKVGASDQAQAFALIDRIQKDQAARGEKVTDADITALAAEAQRASQEAAKPRKKVARDDVPPPVARPKTAVRRAPVATKPADAPPPANEDVSTLEKELEN